MGKKGVDRGELVLLGFFALFAVAFMLDISRLPLEGKMLSYLLAPFILVVMILCVRQVLAESKKHTEGEDGEEEMEAPLAEPKAKHLLPSWRFAATLAAGVLLFSGIYLIGFYLGSGLMLLFWFSFFRRWDRYTLPLTVGAPLLLYLAFEKALDMGLPAGMLWQWLGW